MLQRRHGFTLLELMIVISIIGILATMALPSFQDRIIRAQVQEAIVLSEFVRADIADFYKIRKKLPAVNSMAGLPPANKIVGNYVTRVQVENGAIDIELGNRINRNAAGAILTLRPAIVKGQPKVPIAWVYGNASVPEGMTVVGKNNTTLLAQHLPISCRY